LLALVTVRCVRNDAVGAHAFIVGKVKATSPADVSVAAAGLMTLNNNPDDIECQITLPIPPGYYYKVDQSVGGGSSAVTLIDWWEVVI
jgi:hypothetical protein